LDESVLVQQLSPSLSVGPARRSFHPFHPSVGGFHFLIEPEQLGVWMLGSRGVDRR
jgi:hypothetical protein